jgi:hypothetical protein
MIKDFEAVNFDDVDDIVEMINADRIAFEANMDNVIAGIKTAMVSLQIFDPAPDAPLSLAEAVCLPELGGVLYRWTESEPSTTITVKTLRLAIERGELATTRLNTKNIHITRRQVQEWIARCQDQQSPRISSGSNPNISRAQKRSSNHGDTGQSSMDRSLLARDSAMNFVRTLR